MHLLVLLCCAFSSAVLAFYTQDELSALAEHERNTPPPSNLDDISALIQRSEHHQSEALTLNAHTQAALTHAPLSSVLGTPHVNPAKDAQGVMVFVSLSMPESALRQLLAQSDQYQVPLVIRGVLPSGFVPTANRITELLNHPDGHTLDSGFAISPEWFSQFSITHVPAFVAISEACTEEACQATEYDIVYGNISLPAALDILATGDVGHIAQRVINQRRAP